MRAVHTYLAAAGLCLGLGHAAPASAQDIPTDPFTHTCADFVRAAEGADPATAQYMLVWLTGYLYGRFEGATTGPITADNFAIVRDDMINLLRQVCPNRPDITIAGIAVNFSADLQRQFGGD